MPDELKSFLISVSIILAIALFVSSIEAIANLIRRGTKRPAMATVSESKPGTKRWTGEAA